MNYSRLRASLLVTGAMLLACAVPPAIRAQDSTQNPTQGQAAQGQEKHRGPDLNLTDDQKAQMKKIHEDAKAQIEAVNSDSSLSAEQKKAKIGEIHRATRKQVDDMLTPEQRQTMKEWRKEHREERPAQQPPSN